MAYLYIEDKNKKIITKIKLCQTQKWILLECQTH